MPRRGVERGVVEETRFNPSIRLSPIGRWIVNLHPREILMDTELTGRTRYVERPRLFRRPATDLQVEERRIRDRWYNAGRAGVEVDTIVSTVWRRATVADILNLQKDGKLSKEIGDRMAAHAEI